MSFKLKLSFIVSLLICVPSLAFATSFIYPQGGGTGTNTIPVYGQVLVGNTAGTYTPTATSSLGIAGGSGSPGGLNLQVQYNNAGAFGGISGAVTNGTIMNLTNPLLGGATLTTSSVNGVTLTTGGSATAFLNGTGTYTTPSGGGTVTGVTATYPILSSGGTTPIISTAYGTTTSNTWAGTQTFTNPLTDGSLVGLIGANNGVTYAISTSSLNASITGNAATVTNGVTTLTFNSLFDPRFITDLAATTSVASITTLSNLSLPYSQVTGAPSQFGYPFPSNATSTALTFNGGLTSSGITNSNLGAGTVNSNASGLEYVTATTTPVISTGLTYSGTWPAGIGGAAGSLTNTGVISNSCPGGFLTCSGTNPSSFTLGTLGLVNGGTATTTFYSGGVVFANATNLTQAAGTGAANLFWDNTNNRLGIGTTTPTSTLDINGNLTFDQSATSTISSATAPTGTNSGSIVISTKNTASGSVPGNVTIQPGNGAFNPGGIVYIQAGQNTNNSSFSNVQIQPSGGKVGIGTSSPTYMLSVGTATTNYGSIVSAENKLATSTSMTVDWSVGNQQLIQTGTGATTIAFSRVISGATLRLVICNPGSAAGAVTFTGVDWSAGTVPTQTTTANVCDIWSFVATQATSTTATAFKIFGAQSPNYP